MTVPGETEAESRTAPDIHVPIALAAPAQPPHRELAHLNAIFNSALSAVVGMDEAGYITTWSTQSERTFGRPRADVIGKTVADTIVPPHLREAHRRGLSRYLLSRESHVLGTVVTVTAMRRDGDQFPAELAISPPLVGIDGRTEFIAFIRDISDRVQMERMRAMQFEVTRTLTTSSSLAGAAATILAAVAGALEWPLATLWLVDDVSGQLRQVHAWQAEGAGLDVLVRAGEQLSLGPGEGFPGSIWAAARPVSTEDFATDKRRPRSASVSAAGLHAAAGFPITNRGRVVGVVELMGPRAMVLDGATLSVMMDLGQQIGQFVERVQVTEELARANGELLQRAAELERTRDELIAKTADLERSNTDLEQFARVASHDLQEPLRMVASYVQLLERRYRGKLGDEADEYIGFAVDGSKRMQALVTDLLAYSRSGHDSQDLTAVDVNMCVDTARDNLLSALRDGGGEVVRSDLPQVQANPVEITQVFQNVIGNALKFRGDDPPLVEITAQRDHRFWVFSVRDNGIGIEPGQIDRVFQVFKRLHTRDKYPGTGIGLALCKKIIERFGGRIWLESEPGVGTTFLFTVPAVNA